MTEQLAQPFGDRFAAVYFGSILPFGRPRCEQHDDLAVALQQPLDRRERSGDAQVVVDLAVAAAAR